MNLIKLRFKLDLKKLLNYYIKNLIFKFSFYFIINLINCNRLFYTFIYYFLYN